jgi:hypothetical protein
LISLFAVGEEALEENFLPVPSVSHGIHHSSIVTYAFVTAPSRQHSITFSVLKLDVSSLMQNLAEYRPRKVFIICVIPCLNPDGYFSGISPGLELPMVFP